MMLREGTEETCKVSCNMDSVQRQRQLPALCSWPERDLASRVMLKEGTEETCKVSCNMASVQRQRQLPALCSWPQRDLNGKD
jgi:hypothetical protein